MMENKRRLHNLIKNDRGSTLITVIVAIAFVTILVSIILGTTVVNVRMKGIDRRTHDDFYYAERALNDIYTGIGQELAIIAGDEYEKAFEKVGDIETDGEGNKVDYNLAESAEKEFRKVFIKEAHDLFPSNSSDIKDKLQKYITSTARGEQVDKVTSVEYQKKDGTHADSIADAYRVALRGVEVSATDSSGYRSVISTDIIFNVPTVDFLGTNADVTDYGLIANKGLYIRGSSSQTTEINGNVYAGVHKTQISGTDDHFIEDTDKYSRPELFGGINIDSTNAEFKGNYIISKGDINLAGDKPSIKIYTPSTAVGSENLANLWFTSLRTITGTTLPATTTSGSSTTTIDINANVFALNDLILNADNSSVKIEGNYYGYNDSGSIAGPFLGSVSGRDDGESSAIIINGRHAYLDMQDINNFVLMGKAYIDFTSIDQTKGEAMTAANQIVPTAESVALRTNQQLYLVPPDFLSIANPSVDSNDFSSLSIPDDWFGAKYLAAEKHESRTVTLENPSGTKVYYDYLLFEDNITWKPELDSSNNILRNADGTYKYTEVTGVALGTNRSISSKAKFFLDIMTSKDAYDYAYNHGGKVGGETLEEYIERMEASKTQPSAYRLYERIDRSMGWDYFDLKQCMIGRGTDDAHYYAKNAVINYMRTDVPDGEGGTKPEFQSNVFNNTEGMLRYSRYPANLFNRYIYLCTKLDGKETYLLDEDPGVPGNKDDDWVTEYSDVTKAAPMSHFVKISNIGSMDIGDSITKAESNDGLKRGAYGVCVATEGTLTIDSHFPGLVGNTFYGIAIVKGDIIVDSGYNVNGLLMATGTITLNGGNTVNYDKGLIQSRIEKEMNLVKNSDKTKAEAYKKYYVINYLSKDDSSGRPQLIYDVEPGSKVERERIEADYNDFMHYENWQKGEK